MLPSALTACSSIILLQLLHVLDDESDFSNEESVSDVLVKFSRSLVIES